MGVKQETLIELADELSKFNIHPLLIPDLQKIIKKSSSQQRFYNLFVRRLRFLNEHGRMANQYHEEFERIDERFYSFHMSAKDFNIRVLYTFLPDGCILLHGFYEREGKGNTDYSSALPVAEDRLHEIKE